MASFKKSEWTVKFNGGNVVINFIKPGCMWTGKTWTVTEEFYKSCGSHPLWTANKLAANAAAESRQKFLDAAIAGGFMLLSDTPGLIAEQAASLARRNGRADFDDDSNENVRDGKIAGDYEFLFSDGKTVAGRINSIVIGYDSVRYLSITFNEDCYIGMCNGDPRNTLLPIYSDAKIALRRIS